MAYLHRRPRRIEIRESVATRMGPRSRVLASFAGALTPDVLARAAQPCTTSCGSPIASSRAGPSAGVRRSRSFRASPPAAINVFVAVARGGEVMAALEALGADPLDADQETRLERSGEVDEAKAPHGRDGLPGRSPRRARRGSGLLGGLLVSGARPIPAQTPKSTGRERIWLISPRSLQRISSSRSRASGGRRSRAASIMAQSSRRARLAPMQ